jgi:carboxyl-terminal processing protease
VDEHGKQLHAEYEKDIQKYIRSFNISDEMMASFQSAVKKKGVTVEPAQWEKDVPALKSRIKGEIARTMWGNEGLWRVFQHSDDIQFQKATTLFPEAEKIAGIR